MYTRTPWFIRLVLLLAVLCWTTAGFAQQSRNNPPAKAPTPTPAQQSRLRSMTNAQRRAAAARMAERKAAAGLKNQVVQPAKGGVKK